MRVYLLRHAQSVSNAHPEAASLPEEEGDRLTERGKEQAQRAAEALRDLEITHLIVSPMRRARETAEPIGAALGLSPETDDEIHELRERDGYGELSPEEQKLQRWSEWMVEHADDPDWAPPGAESFSRMRERARGLRARLEPLEAEGATPLVVTHGIFLRFLWEDAVLGDAFGPAQAARLWQLRSVNCGLSALDFKAPHRSVDHEGDDWQCAMWMEPLAG
jgi:broad specificity phosphatase PhoE